MATIREIAQKANVSVSTASIVLRGESDIRKISDSTSQRVYAAAKELGYTANVSARRLRTQESGNLIISIFWATFWASEFRAPTLQFLRGLQAALDETKTKCEIVINQYDRGHLKDSLARFQMCHAAIVCNATREDMLALEQAKLPVPVVLHSRQSQVLPCVYVDYSQVGAIPAKIFCEHGLTRAVIVASSAPFAGAEPCEDAFVKTAVKLGLNVQRMEVEHTMRGGYMAAQAIAQMHAKPDCVFFMSDVLALGALKGFHHCGVRIPEDIQLISLGSYDQDMEEYAFPSLSVVQMPLEAMGAMALKKALMIIGGNKEGKGATKMPVTYISRESCGAVEEGRYDG